MTDKTFKNHIKKCGDLKAKINELTALYDTEKECIIRELKVRDIGDYTACHYQIKFNEYMQNRFDSSKFKIKYPDLYDAYLNEIHSSKFTVKNV